jgi:hypothetical protein
LLSITPGERGRYTLEAILEHSPQLDGMLQEGMDGTLTALVEERPLAAYVLETFLRPFERVIR